MDEVEQDLRGLRPALVSVEVVGIAMVVLVSIWTGHCMGGFSGSDDANLVFNWHPLLMVISLVFLYGNGILVYRVARHERKSRLKVAHAVVMGSATLLAFFGLKAVFDFHSEKEIPHTYSLHSWLGLMAVSLAVLQWILGLVTFLFPGLASHLRKALLPVHVFTGLAVFILAAVTALLGITEKAIFRDKDKEFSYKDGGGEATVVNLLGISIVVFVVLILAIVTRQSFRRLNMAEDQMLLTEGHAE